MQYSQDRNLLLNVVRLLLDYWNDFVYWFCDRYWNGLVHWNDYRFRHCANEGERGTIRMHAN